MNLNTATAEQLEGLPLIGPARAARIVRYRTEVGEFNSVDDLLNVEGIGPGTLTALRPLIRTR
jgi:competence protein ComEA